MIYQIKYSNHQNNKPLPNFEEQTQKRAENKSPRFFSIIKNFEKHNRIKGAKKSHDKITITPITINTIIENKKYTIEKTIIQRISNRRFRAKEINNRENTIEKFEKT
jgi:hypothetical protein